MKIITERTLKHNVKVNQLVNPKDAITKSQAQAAKLHQQQQPIKKSEDYNSAPSKHQATVLEESKDSDRNESRRTGSNLGNLDDETS